MLHCQGAELSLASIPSPAIVRGLCNDSNRSSALQLWLAYAGPGGAQFSGYLITGISDLNDLVAFCPVSQDLVVGGVLWRCEIRRQWRLANIILTGVGEERADVIWLRGVGADLREVPVWLYSLSCIPVREDWNGTLHHPQPFCPTLFESMARQPAASHWMVQRSLVHRRLSLL